MNKRRIAMIWMPRTAVLTGTGVALMLIFLSVPLGAFSSSSTQVPSTDTPSTKTPVDPYTVAQLGVRLLLPSETPLSYHRIETATIQLFPYLAASFLKADELMAKFMEVCEVSPDGELDVRCSNGWYAPERYFRTVLERDEVPLLVQALPPQAESHGRADISSRIKCATPVPADGLPCIIPVWREAYGIWVEYNGNFYEIQIRVTTPLEQ